MRYDTIHLDSPLETVREHIAKGVADVRIRSAGESIEYYTNAGVHVATLSPDSTGTSSGSKLRYRSVFVRPQLGHARRKAKEIRAAATSGGGDSMGR